MKRDLHELASNQYDILVIGGGIYGAFLAWDAALRGYSTALVERHDFGSATSAASLKVIHGGLRYLQSGNLPLMLMMKKEQRIFMNIAPHLVHSLPCILPTYNKLSRSQAAFTAALAVNNSADRLGQRHLRPDKRLEPGHLLSRDKYFDLFPGIRKDRVTGGVQWTEGFLENPNRFVIAILESAFSQGAQIANYAEVVGLLKDKGRVFGAVVKDNLSAESFEIRAKLVINSAGAWVDDVANSIKGSQEVDLRFRRSIAFNVVSRKVIPDEMLAGFSSRRAFKGHLENTGLGPLLFAINWGNHTLFGTKHIHVPPDEKALPVSKADVQAFADEINSGLAETSINLPDVVDILWGYLPMEQNHNSNSEVKLIRDIQVIDHGAEGISGLISVIGVRYTLARNIAERAIDLAGKKIKKTVNNCRTQVTPVAGGDIPHLEHFYRQVSEHVSHNVQEKVLRQLARTYGKDYQRVLGYIDEDSTLKEVLPGNQPVLKAEVVHAVREEMAQKIGDILQRRTELAPVGRIDELLLLKCAETMAHELNWDRDYMEQEMIEWKQQKQSSVPV